MGKVSSDLVVALRRLRQLFDLPGDVSGSLATDDHEAALSIVESNVGQIVHRASHLLGQVLFSAMPNTGIARFGFEEATRGTQS